jgi:hypothetical protein
LTAQLKALYEVLCETSMPRYPRARAGRASASRLLIMLGETGEGHEEVLRLITGGKVGDEPEDLEEKWGWAVVTTT